MRSRTAKRLAPDAEKLVGLSLALYASGSRTEDRFWETRIDALIIKALRGGNQSALDAPLDHLQQHHPDAYGALADLAETHSESASITHEGVDYDAVLIAAPLLAWTRYAIASGTLKPDTAEALKSQLQAHVLAHDVRVALVPYLYSIDQLPRHHVDTFKLMQQLTQSALAGSVPRLGLTDLPETSQILADPRFLIAIAVAPAGAPLFRWQEEEGGSRIERGQCLEQWRAQGGANLASVLAGCEFECLLPDAYHAACRDADEGIRPHTVRTAVRYLEDVLDCKAADLRAVIGGFGERHIDEYRIGFTQRGSNDVLYGVVWPLYGRESGDESAEQGKVSPDDATSGGPVEDVVALLKETGVTEVRRMPDRHDPEYCDDCGVPLYLDPLGEVVHAEMPEDAEPAQPHFH